MWGRCRFFVPHAPYREAEVKGVEINATLADLARRNARENGLAYEVFEADIMQMPRSLLDLALTM